MDKSPPVVYRTLSPSRPLPCYLSLQFLIVQCKAMGITDHILPLGSLFFIVVISKGCIHLYSNFSGRELGDMIPKSQIWYPCSNDLGTGYIRSFWPHLWQATLTMYLYSKYATYTYDFAEESLVIYFLSLKFGICAQISRKLAILGHFGHILGRWGL